MPDITAQLKKKWPTTSSKFINTKTINCMIFLSGEVMWASTNCVKQECLLLIMLSMGFSTVIQLRLGGETTGYLRKKQAVTALCWKGLGDQPL